MAGHVFIYILTCFFIEMQVTQVKALPQAKLTENPSVIKPTDSVSLSCWAPSDVSVHQCYFYVNRENPRPCSCVETFTGTKLLLMSRKTSPAVIEVRCFYTVLYGDVNAPSPHSDPSYITISQKPQLSVDPGEYFIFTCSLPGSMNPHTSCNLYFGEAKHPAETKTIRNKKNKNHQWFCQFFIQEEDILRRLHLVQQKDASCDYSDEESLSPRSDPYILSEFNRLQKTLASASTTGQAVKEPHVTTAPMDAVTIHSTAALIFTQTKTKRNPGQTVIDVTTAQVTSDVQGPEKQTSAAKTTTPVKNTVSTGHNNTETRPKWAWPVGVAAGLTVGIIIFVLACVSSKRLSDKKVQKRHQTNFTAELTCTTSAGEAGVHSMIQSVPGADSATGSDKLHQKEPQNDDDNVYHLYCTISELPPPSSNMVYSLLQTQ